MVDPNAVSPTEVQSYADLMFIVIFFWAYLIHVFVESFFVNALMLDQMKNLRRRRLCYAIVSGLSFGLLMTGALWLSVMSVSILSFALLMVIGMIAGYRWARITECNP